MDKGLLTRILGFISIPIILRGIVSLIMREKEREMTYNLRKERIVIRPPKVIGWIAVMEMLFWLFSLRFTGCLSSMDHVGMAG